MPHTHLAQAYHLFLQEAQASGRKPPHYQIPKCSFCTTLGTAEGLNGYAFCRAPIQISGRLNASERGVGITLGHHTSQ